MTMLRRLGELERAVMDELWDSDGPQTVREVHNSLLAERELAYTTVMTVLHRLHCKDIVVQGVAAGSPEQTGLGARLLRHGGYGLRHRS